MKYFFYSFIIFLMLSSAQNLTASQRHHTEYMRNNSFDDYWNSKKSPIKQPSLEERTTARLDRHSLKITKLKRAVKELRLEVKQITTEFKSLETSILFLKIRTEEQFKQIFAALQQLGISQRKEEIPTGTKDPA